MRSRLLVLLLALVGTAALGARPAAAEWRRAESPNFILYGEGSENRLRERILLLEEFHRLLLAMTSVEAAESPNKLSIYLVSGDLRRVRPNMPSGGAGFYASNPYGTAAFVDTSAEIVAQEVLFHEYVHHFMWQYAPSAYPAWYVEGFAEYFMPTQFDRREVHIGRASAIRAWSVLDGNWIPMEQVLFETPHRLNREDRQRFYTQAWMVVHYFNSDPALQAKLRAYLAALAAGTDPRVAFERETGLTMAALTRALRGYFGDGRIPYRRMVRPTVAPPPVSIAALPRSANDLVLYEASLRIGARGVESDDLLRRIRAAAARHAEDPFAQRVLAHAEVVLGDRAAGQRGLEGLIQAQPNDAELLYLMGMRHLIEAEKGEDWETHGRTAARWFARAYRVNGSHYQTLYRYAQSLRGRAAYDSDNTANILALARQLAPQVEEISMTTAAMLIGRGDHELAEAILRPLAAHPHNEELSLAAQHMLDQAQQVRAAARDATATTDAPAANSPEQ